MENRIENKNGCLNRPLSSFLQINIETVILVSILLLAVFSRLFHLGERVMSHDEINHVYFAWQYFTGSPYSHHPLSHGPFQFHILYLSYFLLGVSDFSARFPAAVFSILSVFLAWKFKRYFGRSGGLAAAALFVISPYLLFYGRYARNEAFVLVFGLITLWSILRYLESSESRFLYILTAATALHFATKETSFIYTAQALLFLALIFFYELGKIKWEKRDYQIFFYSCLTLAFVVFASAMAVYVHYSGSETPQSSAVIILSAIGSGILIFSVLFLIMGFGWQELINLRSFELILLLGTLVLPHLSAFPLSWLGWDPMDYQSQTGILRMLAVLLPLFIISTSIGLSWKPREWLVSMGIFYAIFIPFFTSFFTNGIGFFSGIVGSLGYWIVQQGVERGSQPWFFYLLQVPFYEFIAVIGVVSASVFGIYKLITHSRAKQIKSLEEVEETNEEVIQPPDHFKTTRYYTFFLLIFWSLTSLIAYTIAGEKMPWLTVHITWPMLLLTGWVIGSVIDRINWPDLLKKRGLLVLTVSFLFLTSLIMFLYNLVQVINVPGVAGLDSIQNSSSLVFSLLMSLGCMAGLYHLLRGWQPKQYMYLLGLGFFAILSLLTTRSAVLSNYINFDLATEYLVYAHAGPAPGQILNQVEDLSERITGGKDLRVAYDNYTAYPFWWYFRDYPNQNAYGEEPTRQLRDYPVILVGDANYGKIEAIVGNAYDSFEYIRMWWPNQDYFDLNFVLGYIKDPLTRWDMINALFKIWLNRDYTKYGEVLGRDMSLRNWIPSNKMRLYIRKDILSSVWDYGVSPGEQASLSFTPYEEKYTEISPDKILGIPNTGEFTLSSPHDLAFAPDGTIYITDSDNHRILHIDADGTLLNVWGSYGSPDGEQNSYGLFNQPWGIAVDQEGMVYVADTWNHRIQKFTSSGKFLKSWGTFGQAENPFALWGPRDVEIDDDGNVLVTDTGNKRIIIYTPEGEVLGEFGVSGVGEGEFNEPVGMAFDAQSKRLFVADTWNQRVQAFDKTNGEYTYTNSWDISGWFGQSLANKPFLAVNPQGQVFVADPELGAIYVFDSAGNYISTLINSPEFASVAGIQFDEEGNLWVSDAINNRIFKISFPLIG